MIDFAMASRSWNDRVSEEEACRPDACVENPEMVVEETAVASPEHSDVTLPDVSEDFQSPTLMLTLLLRLTLLGKILHMPTLYALTYWRRKLTMMVM